MKRLLIPLFAVCLIALAVPAFAQVELGLSWTPVQGVANAAGGNMESATGFHVGYTVWHVVFLSWDSIVMPPAFITNATGYWDSRNNVYVDGPYLPGFLNLYDVGLQFVLKPFLLYTEVGLNNLYVYQNSGGGDFGANLRLGAGLKFGWWGLNVSGTAVFPDFTTMTETLKKLVSSETRNEAISTITGLLVPSVNLTVYF